MRQRHLLTCGLDDKLAQRLHQWVQQHGIGLRAVRQPNAALSLLRQGAVGVSSQQRKPSCGNWAVAVCRPATIALG